MNYFSRFLHTVVFERRAFRFHKPKSFHYSFSLKNIYDAIKVAERKRCLLTLTSFSPRYVKTY